MIKINLLRETARKKAKARTPNTTFLISLLFGLIGIGIATCYWNWQLTVNRSRQLVELSQLQMEQTRLARIQTQLERFSQEKAQLDSRVNVVQTLLANRSGPVTLMNALIDSVPDQPKLWLRRLSQTRNKVTIEGSALDVPSISQFITNLNQHETFRKVDLDFWEKNSDAIRFQLSCIVENR